MSLTNIVAIVSSEFIEETCREAEKDMDGFIERAVRDFKSMGPAIQPAALARLHYMHERATPDQKVVLEKLIDAVLEKTE